MNPPMPIPMTNAAEVRGTGDKIPWLLASAVLAINLLLLSHVKNAMIIPNTIKEESITKRLG